MNRHRLVLPLLMLSLWGCGGETSGQDNTKTAAGTTGHAGTQQSKGGTSAATGGRSSAQTVLGGTSSISVTASGGVNSAVTVTYVGGVANATGGASNGGTSNGIGGTPSTGGSRSAGGASTVGGSAPSGGTASATGGSTNNGGTSTAFATNVGGSAPATGGTSAPSGGTGSTGGTTAAWKDPNPTVCDDASLFVMNATAQYKKSAFPLSNNPTKTYIATTNWWHWFAGQAVAFNGLSYAITGASSTNDNYPAGYPSFYIGSYQTTNSIGSNLPKPVSSIGSVPVVFDTNVTALDNSHLNASIDVWFNTSNTPLGVNDNAPTGGYLMVWLNKPSGRQPRGSIVATAQAIGSVSGTWNVWSDGKCVSYVRTSPVDSLTFDLNDFVRNAVTNSRVIKASWYLAVIFGGFEIWNGGSGAKVNQFCAKVNPVAAAVP